MSDQGKSIPVDLTQYTESLRRELYDAVVQLIWTPAGPEERVPAFTPDQAQLTVLYSHGRWIAVWLDLEEPAYAPPDHRAQMARVLASPDSPFGITLAELYR